MFKYTVFFAIRCFASDTVPEVARCSGPKSGTERILTAVRRPFRRILRAGIFRGARSRFVRFVGSCARHSCREGRCNLFFCFPRSGLQRLPEEAGPVAFPRMPCFRPVSEPETAGMSSCAVRSACVPIGLQPKVRLCRGGIRILSREDSFVSIILIYFALI